jgi:hypothetical protein
VIAVFTKYDQFKYDVEMELEDMSEGGYSKADLKAEVERRFREEYLDKLEGFPPFVRLESKACVNR